MDFTVSTQLVLFMFSMLGGALLVLIFDLFRLKRKFKKTSDFVVYAEDILYWIISAFVLFFVIFFAEIGEIRVFVVLGIVIGAVLYILLLSKLVMDFLILTIRFIHTVWKIILIPFKLLLNFIRPPLKLLKEKLISLLKMASRKSKEKIKQVYDTTSRKSKEKIGSIYKKVSDYLSKNTALLLKKMFPKMKKKRKRRKKRKKKVVKTIKKDEVVVARKLSDLDKF